MALKPVKSKEIAHVEKIDHASTTSYESLINTNNSNSSSTLNDTISLEKLPKNGKYLV